MSAIAWSAIDWMSLVALSILVLITARIGQSLSFNTRGHRRTNHGAVVRRRVCSLVLLCHDTVRHALAGIVPGISG